MRAEILGARTLFSVRYHVCINCGFVGIIDNVLCLIKGEHYVLMRANNAAVTVDPYIHKIKCLCAIT